MARVRQTVKSTTKRTTYRKSNTRKNKNGHRRCKTCGRFM